jgi:N-acetylglucosaminyl-diphospho-decaprenol L-rhamnosyltransferase
MALSDLTVIVVIFNSAHCLRENASFLRQLPNLIFVDNASSDDSLDFARKEITNAILISNRENKGFGAANNQAIRSAKTPYVFLLNPDCTISLTMLEKLLDYVQLYPDAAILAPQLLRKNGDIDISYRWPRSYWESSGGASDAACCVGFVSGAAMLFNLKNSQQLAFDESYFLYYEDDDLCQRIFEERSQIILIPDVKVTHELGGSVKYKKPFIQHFHGGYHMTQSEIIYISRYAGRSAAKSRKIRIAVSSLVKLLLAVLILSPRKFLRYLGRLVGILNLRT